MLPETIHRRIDPLTLGSLSILLHQDFTCAGSWGDLRSRLGDKGFELRECAGRYHLVTQPHGVAVCRVGAIGHPSRVLSRQLGEFVS